MDADKFVPQQIKKVYTWLCFNYKYLDCKKSQMLIKHLNLSAFISVHPRPSAVNYSYLNHIDL